MAQELDPYFRAIKRRGWRPQSILDAGAEAGLFSVVAGLLYRPEHVTALEPSRRNRILLDRNLRLNGLRCTTVIRPEALWNQPARLAFRTHGAISALRDADSLPSQLAFTEHVPAVPLDDIVAKLRLRPLHLIKMDIEGAELEAIEGARRTLGPGGVRPNLLIQAYHIRNGVRTFERCAEALRGLDYCTEEGEHGLLIAWPSERP